MKPKRHNSGQRPGQAAVGGTLRELEGRPPGDASSEDARAPLPDPSGLEPLDLHEVSPCMRHGCPGGSAGKFICIRPDFADHAARSSLDAASAPVGSTKAKRVAELLAWNLRPC